MKFDVKVVFECLKSNGEVFTVREWETKNKFSVVPVNNIGDCIKEKLFQVGSMVDLVPYVGLSGFGSAQEWWDKVLEFDAQGGWLYRVAILSEEPEQNITSTWTQEQSDKEFDKMNQEWILDMKNEEEKVSSSQSSSLIKGKDGLWIYQSHPNDSQSTVNASDKDKSASESEIIQAFTICRSRLTGGCKGECKPCWFEAVKIQNEQVI